MDIFFNINMTMSLICIAMLVIDLSDLMSKNFRYYPIIGGLIIMTNALGWFAYIIIKLIWM